MNEEVILRFDEVSFEYQHDKPILHEASFSVHRGAKITLMGQNGAGKSSLFALIMNELKANLWGRFCHKHVFGDKMIFSWN